MSKHQPLTHDQILEYYVRLRRYGLSGEQVVACLDAEAMRLSHQERRHLNQEVIRWEKAYKHDRAQAQSVSV